MNLFRLAEITICSILVVVFMIKDVSGREFGQNTHVEYPFLGDKNSFVRASADGKYHPLPFSADDLYYMTEALYFEAATEPEMCQMLVAEVILNRKMDSRWSNTVKGVIWDKYQFSYTFDGKPEQMLDLDARRRLEKVSAKVLGGHVKDLSNGALYYYNPDLANPDWDWDKIELVAKCADHVFYKDKDTDLDFS